MVNAASTSNPSFILDVGEAYPYPSVIGPNFVTMKLSGKDTYNVWETQILCLLKSHHMRGFINGQFPNPAMDETKIEGDMEAWDASDSLVKGWILGSLCDEVVKKVVKRLRTDFSAKDLWDELQRNYRPWVVVETKLPTRQSESKDESLNSWDKSMKEREKRWLYDSIIKGETKSVISQLKRIGLNPWDKLTPNGNTVLHVAVGSSTKNNQRLLKELLAMTPPEKLLDIINSDGSSLLHVAAIGGNTEAVNMLVERNPELLLAKDKEGHTPLALSISNMHVMTSNCLFKHMRENGYDAFFLGQSSEDLVVLAISCQDFRLANMIINYHGYAIRSDSDAVLMALAQNFPRELNFWERGWREEFYRISAPYKPTVERLANIWDSSRGPLKILIILFAILFYGMS